MVNVVVNLLYLIDLELFQKTIIGRIKTLIPILDT